MSSFIFNEFKKRFLKGEVENNGTKWLFKPVKKDFIENLTGENIKPEQFKNIDSIREYLNNNEENGFANVMCDLYKIEYEYSKLVEAKYSNKPAYITKDNLVEFLTAYPKEKYLETLFFDTNSKECIFAKYGGFYFIKTKEELKWCANRVNGDNDDGERGDNFNNHIAIVLGDDIGEYTDQTEINFTIGRYADRPFEGLFYGNGYIFQNLKFNVTSDVGGLVGHLGHSGILNHLIIFGNTEVENEKKINLTHIKNQGTDVCFGCICACNKGLIQDCRISGLAKDKQNFIPTITFHGFVPQVYMVQNKSERQDVPVSQDKDNEFFPNYFCINSPGNIVPYVGYFAEGCPSIVSARPYPATNPTYPCWLDDTDEKNKIADWTGTMLLSDNSAKEDGIPADANGWGNQFLMDYNNVKKTADAIGELVRGNDFGFDCMIPDPSNPGPSDFQHTHQIVYNQVSNWSNHSVKMHQFARAAYYVSPFCGWNKGMIINCESRTYSEFKGTFVGFCGGLVGKSAGGIINGCNVYIQPQDDAVASRDIFMTSAESNISNNSPLIDLCVRNWNWQNINQQDLDDITTRNVDSTSTTSASAISANNLLDVACVYQRSSTNPQFCEDRYGIASCPWNNTAQGLMLQFDGVSATSTYKTAIYTFSSTSAKPLNQADIENGVLNSNSALNIYNAAISTGNYTSGEGYNLTVNNGTVALGKIKAPNRVHKDYYDKFTSAVNGTTIKIYDNPAEYHAVWFPLIPDGDTEVFYNYEFDTTENCYVIKNASFRLGCGYEVLSNQLSGTASTPFPDYQIDAVYPDFTLDNDTNIYLVKSQRDTKWNHPNSASVGYSDDTSWSATKNTNYNVQIERLNAPNGNFLTGLEIDAPAGSNVDYVYKNSCDFTSGANPLYPTIDIDKMYFLPFNTDINKDNLIKKYTNNGTKYIEGYPLALVKLEGIHIKNKHAVLKPKTSETTNSVIEITEYDMYIKAIGKFKNVKNHFGIAEQSPNANDNKPTMLYVGVKNYKNNSETVFRGFIGNCGQQQYDIFEIDDSVSNPYNSMYKPQYFLNVNVGTEGESFRTELQSIYNVGGLIGSLAIAPQITQIYNTSAYLNNKISEGMSYSAIRETDKTTSAIKDRLDVSWNDVKSKNYLFLNRFGGLASICEFNTSNIEDYAPKPIVCDNVQLQYNEEIDAFRDWDKDNWNWKIDMDNNQKITSAVSAQGSRLFSGPMHWNNNASTCPFGIASPIVAEIKPTYNMFPGINSYINTWKGDKSAAKNKDGGADGKYDSEHTDNYHEIYGFAYYGNFSNDLGMMYNDYNLGLYTLDLNVDTPLENMYRDTTYQNPEATTYKYEWMPGLNSNVADASNYGGLPMLAQKLFKGCHVKDMNMGYFNGDTYYQGAGYRSTLNAIGTVHYPAAICRDISLKQGHNHVFKHAQNKGDYQYEDVVYKTSKHESTYSYFGSSLGIDYLASGKHVYNDILLSYQDDWTSCPSDGVDLSNAKLTNFPMSIFKTRDEEDQYFTYTYNTPSGTNGLPKKLPIPNYNVKFAIADNGKIGYWLEDPIAGISGDNFVYNHNIIHLGITKSPEQIRKEILDPKGDHIARTSAISGEDFSGLWVYDDKGNNVMYIDTSVGDCDGLSTWSMQLDSGLVDGKQMGCILEIK